MKFNRKFIALVIVLSIIVNFSLISLISVSAHSTMLNIKYDDCDGEHYVHHPSLGKRQLYPLGWHRRFG